MNAGTFETEVFTALVLYLNLTLFSNVGHYWFNRYGQLLGYQSFSGVSMQCSPITGLSDTLEWVKRSSDSGQKWVVTIDEQNPAGVGVAPDSVDILHNIIRSNILWANLIAGGGGVEYYFGYNYDNSDLNCEDFRTREAMWDQSRYALEFFSNNNVSFWTMTNANHLVSVDNWCMKSTNADSIVVYAQSSVVLIDIDQVYKIKWYDPLLGGRLQDGSMSIVTPGQSQSLGDPPNIGTDWVVLLRCIECSN